MELPLEVKKKLVEQLEEIYRGGPKGNPWQARPLLGEYIEKIKAVIQQTEEKPAEPVERSAPNN